MPKRDARAKRGHDNGEVGVMPIVQSIDSALEKNVGRTALPTARLTAALARAEGALDWLRARHADGSAAAAAAAGKA